MAGVPQSATVTLDANQQLARLLSEFVSGVSSQLGGYIHIHSRPADLDLGDLRLRPHHGVGPPL